MVTAIPLVAQPVYTMSTQTPAPPSPPVKAGRRRRPLPRWKRLLFSVLAGLLAWGTIEFVSLVILAWIYGTVESVQYHLDRQANSNAIIGMGIDSVAEDSNPLPNDIPHPYIGFARRPRTAKDPNFGTSEFGFVSQHSPVRHREPGVVLVGLTGGSVAEFLEAETGVHLRTLLEESPRFHGRKVVLVPLALASYKQPQQLMQLNFLLSLGAEFDLLLNLDGYNEVALTATANVPNRVFPAYPREWHMRVSRASDLETLRLVGRVVLLRDGSQWWARCFARAPLRWSPTALLVWQRGHNHFQQEATRNYAALNAKISSTTDLASTGPQQKFANDAELHEHCVALWRRSSLQMHQLAEGAGIQYFHFLQPNQYLPGSKPIEEGERQIAFDESHTAKPHVEQAYPLLRAAGAELRRKHQVRFHDLTQLFHDTEWAAYRDSCCHLNAFGNKLLAEAIVKAVNDEAAMEH